VPEWAGQAGLGKISISSGPMIFGGLIGKIAENSSSFDGLVTFGGFLAQFSLAVYGPAKIGYNFQRAT
jgi:hypothetical protein